MNNSSTPQVSWEKLKYFLALASEGRLQKAANKIGSNHTTVYRNIKSLEEELNNALFQSTPSGYTLTPYGEGLYMVTQGLEEKMDEIHRAIYGMDSSYEGSVCITTTTSIANTLLPPILKKIKNSHPKLNIELRVSNLALNLSKREADIAIRPSSEIPEYLVGRRITYLDFSVFSSHSLTKKLTISNLIQWTQEHDILSLDDSLSHLKSKMWWDKIIDGHPRIYYTDNITTMAHMCRSGLGLAVLPNYMGRHFEGLIKVHTPKQKIGSDLWVLSHKDYSRNNRVQEVKDILVKELKSALVE